MASKSQEGKRSGASSSIDEFERLSYGLGLLAKMIARRHMNISLKGQAVSGDNTSGLGENQEAEPKDEGNE